jgi:hypothetical protein
MDIHPVKDLVAAAAEDCTLGVWALPMCGQKVRGQQQGGAAQPNSLERDTNCVALPADAAAWHYAKQLE